MELYHHGFVVDDIEAAMASYGVTLGLAWAEVTTREVRVVLDETGEPVDVRLLATYSRQGPPHVELIQELDGDVWSRGSRGLDHLGYWVDDLGATFERLRDEAGLDASVQNVGADGEPCRFSYQRPSAGGGPWIELVDSGVRPQLTAWVCGEAYDVR